MTALLQAVQFAVDWLSTLRWNQCPVCGGIGVQVGVEYAYLPPFLEFQAKYKARFNPDPGETAPFTYDAVKALVAAMKKAGSAEPRNFMGELARIKHLGVTDSIQFDADGNRLEGPVVIYQLVDGKWDPNFIATDKGWKPF